LASEIELATGLHKGIFGRCWRTETIPKQVVEGDQVGASPKPEKEGNIHKSDVVIIPHYNL
jgi:hypothetical protein